MTAPRPLIQVQACVAQGRGALQAGRCQEALRHFGRALALDPASAEAHRGSARALVAMDGDAVKAIRHMEAAIKILPYDAPCRIELARILAATGDAARALTELQMAIQVDRRNADCWHEYAEALAALNRKEEAEKAYVTSLQCNPQHERARERLARLLLDHGRPEQAQVHWAQLVARGGTVAQWLGYAQSRWEAGEIAASLHVYEEAAARFPDCADVAMAHALALEDQGEEQRAEDEYRRALALRPGWAYALGSLLELKRGRVDPQVLAEAERLFAQEQTKPADRALLGFGLGKVYDSLGRYSEAFAAWRKANEARRLESGPLNRSFVVERVDRLIACFPRKLWTSKLERGSQDDRPVFIVGMPRSGTSLVEQILAAHPQAAGCGELPHIARLCRSLPAYEGTLLTWPEAAPYLTRASLERGAQDYLRILAGRAEKNAARISDKAPTNFFHLGLIALLFPKARVLWCRRDPRDVAISIYSENFARQQAYSTDLADIAFYRAEHERLMKHWLATLPLSILEIRYEELVQDLGSGVRRLLAFLDLPFAAECLQFHKADRQVTTPSKWQVRKPIYASSIGRWRPYEPWMAEFLPLFPRVDESPVPTQSS